MKYIYLILGVLSLNSCMNQIDYMVKDHPKKGSQHFYMVTAWGGQHATESSAGTRWTGNLENSFQVAAQSIVTGYGTYAWKVARLGELANEQFLQGQITLRQKQEFDFLLGQIHSEADLLKFMAGISATQ